ncbi:MAG: diaminopimelate decarboxylase [Gaiellales bacterium]|nr:MAG: diaminopimelate decarboxylase [Gaiellales bacterium]
MKITIPPLPSSSRTNDEGHLEVAGCDVVALASEFGTPLIIYDEEQIREHCRTYLQSFRARTDDFEIAYASKAFTCLAMCQLLAEEDMSLDVASGGELYTALKAWFPPEKIYMHGNANNTEELARGIRSEVGHIVADSMDEILALNRIAVKNSRRQPVMIRVTPGVEAHTHDFIKTGKQDSKFGIGIADDRAFSAVALAMEQENLELVGLHMHIGSQIFDLEPYSQALAVMADFMARCQQELGFDCRVLDAGGGLGASYLSGDQPAGIDSFAEVVVGGTRREMERVGLPVPHIVVEPGRSIVANAGLTVYTVETVKEIPGIRTYVAVSGGMSDNMRPMLYGARYEALLANRATEQDAGTYTIAGKHCESGDILVKEAQLPEPQPGDLLVTPATGAYGYSMSSNYNGQPRPAVLFVKKGAARVIIRRESYEDLVHLHERLE